MVIETSPDGYLINVPGYKAPSGRTLVPLRGIAAWLGATIAYQATDQSLTVTKGDLAVVLKLGAREASVRQGQQARTVALAEPAREEGGLTLVPLRFVAEAFGCGVAVGDHRNHRDCVELRDGARTARLMPHSLPPADVMGIRGAAPWDKMGTPARSHVIWRVVEPYHNYAKAWAEDVCLCPTDDRPNPHYFFDTGCLFRKVDGVWQRVPEFFWAGEGSLNDGRQRAARNGVPLDVLKHYWGGDPVFHPGI